MTELSKLKEELIKLKEGLRQMRKKEKGPVSLVEVYRALI